MVKESIRKILESRHHDPFNVLGMHPVKPKNAPPHIVVRAFNPFSSAITVISTQNQGGEWPMTLIHEEGFFEVDIMEHTDVFSYQLKIQNKDGSEETIYDPYSFLPILTEFDRHLFNEGNHLRLYDKFGAHTITVNGISGVQFAVWAPNAMRVSVVGDFNQWDGRVHSMRVLGMSGVWEIFIPGLPEGTIYKFEIKAQNGLVFLKTDPYAFYFEKRPKNAAIVHTIENYEWHDEGWMENRPKTNWFERPVSVYEVHLGSWRRVPEEDNRFLTYRELADQLIPHAKEMGFTHLELLPVAEHPLDVSWGYQVTGYFAPTSRFGTPEDFMYFVDKAHQHGLGVILDWVPAHFPKDDWALSGFDGTCLYEHQDPRLGEQQDWGTKIFNFGRNEVRSFLLSNALYWFDKYHIDGLRVDAVASMLYLDYSRKQGEWIPNKYGGRENLEAIDFIRKFNEVVHQYYPGALTIAEESTAWGGVSKPTYLGGLGFSMKWNMGWMHDILEYFSKEAIFRKYHHNNLTFAMLYAFHENFVLVLSHDEVVHGKKSLLSKMPGYEPDRFANMRSLFGYMYAQPGKKLLFMGAEIGQWNEWNSNTSLDWHLLDFAPHKGLQKFLGDLNKVYQTEPALHEVDFEYTGFEWIDFRDSDNSIVSFIRRGKNPQDYIVCVFNFTPVFREKYRVGVPDLVYYKEILNSDAAEFGGQNRGNSGGLMAEDSKWQDKPYSIEITLPPLSALYFKPVKQV